MLDAAGHDPEAEARRLHADDTDGFRALATIVSGAYFMNLKVRKRIGFPGQGKRPPFSDEADYDLRDGLLDPISGAPSYQIRPLRSRRMARSSLYRSRCP